MIAFSHQVMQRPPQAKILDYFMQPGVILKLLCATSNQASKADLLSWRI